jgi:hypothetical protein
MTDDEIRSLVEELLGFEDPTVTGADGPQLHWSPDNDQTD